MHDAMLYVASIGMSGECHPHPLNWSTCLVHTLNIYKRRHWCMCVCSIRRPTTWQRPTSSRISPQSSSGQLSSHSNTLSTSHPTCWLYSYSDVIAYILQTLIAPTENWYVDRRSASVSVTEAHPPPIAQAEARFAPYNLPSHSHRLTINLNLPPQKLLPFAWSIYIHISTTCTHRKNIIHIIQL